MWEPGVMIWADRDDLATAKKMGVRTGQLAFPEALPLDDAAEQKWKASMREHDFTITTLFAVYDGEDYADIPTVKRTVGFIPRGTRERREKRTFELSDFAAKLGIKAVACHIGFVPEDQSDPDYIAVREMVRRVCDHAAQHGQVFALETGQEPAHILLAFIRDVARPNLKINFDPANLILYGSGEPIEALRQLAPLVVSVHAKDGDWPPKDKPGALGSERPLGKGSVGVPKFVATLKEIGFPGPLNVERETHDPAERLRDMAAGVELLRSLGVG